MTDDKENFSTLQRVCGIYFKLNAILIMVYTEVVLLHIIALLVIFTMTQVPNGPGIMFYTNDWTGNGGGDPAWGVKTDTKSHREQTQVSHAHSERVLSSGDIQ